MYVLITADSWTYTIKCSATDDVLLYNNAFKNVCKDLHAILISTSTVLLPQTEANTQIYFCADSSIYACATDTNNTYVVYFYNQTTNTGTIGNMNASATYTAKWFNPRTNEYQMISQSIQANTTDANGKPGYTLPSKPDNNDWVVLVTKN